MGAKVSLDAKPPELGELAAIRPPNGPLPAAKFRSNLKMWRFFATESGPLDVSSQAVQPRSFRGFDSRECYMILHIYARRDALLDGPAAARSAAPPPPAGTQPKQSGDVVSVSQLSDDTGELFTPRGLCGPFSGYEECGPYPYEQNYGSEARDERLAHDIYVWNGKQALALTKAVALTKCFEVERLLINDDAGATRYLQRGQGGELLAADELFGSDALPTSPESAEANHLLSLLSLQVRDAPEMRPRRARDACMLTSPSSRRRPTAR